MKITLHCEGNWSKAVWDKSKYCCNADSSHEPHDLEIDNLDQHDVREDYVGINPRPRLTCYSKHCPIKPGDTLVAQPYMDSTKWNGLVTIFMNRHPCNKIKREH